MNATLWLGMLTAGAGFFLLFSVRRLSRLGRLKFAYALGWGLIGLLGLLAPVVTIAIDWLLQSRDVPIDTLLLFIGIVFFIILLMQLSISVSGLSRQLMAVAERVAELEHLVNKDGDKFGSTQD